MEPRIYFNGIKLDRPGTGDQAYSRPPLPLESLLAQLDETPHEDTLATKDVVDGVDPDDLAQAGWGFIVHEHENPAVLEALQPLFNRREKDAGARYFGALRYEEGDTWDSFLRHHGAGPAAANPKNLPYYLLIVGEPSRIPFSFQSELDVSYGLGRICLPDVQAFAHYADNVISYQQSQAPASHRLALFGPHNRDVLTELSIDNLVQPLNDALVEKKEEEDQDWLLEPYLGLEATRSRLESLLAAPPSIFFSATHGTTSFNNPHHMKRKQGGLVCADWDAAQLIDSHHCFYGEDLVENSDLRGMISFNFGCFTAGTPRRGIALPGQSRPQLSERSFVSHLHQSMLGKKNGALAAVGHVDAAYQHSFMWHDYYRDMDHFIGTMARMLRGKTVGWAMEYFNRRLADVAARIVGRMFDQPPPRGMVRLQQWLAFLDARNYVVLGDPAVRLNVREELS